MLNKEKSEVILNKSFEFNLVFWKREGNDDREVTKNALEDMIGLYKANNGCLHDPYVPRGEELDIQATLSFFRYRCMDIYGKKWKDKWIEYEL